MRTMPVIVLALLASGCAATFRGPSATAPDPTYTASTVPADVLWDAALDAIIDTRGRIEYLNTESRLATARFLVAQGATFDGREWRPNPLAAEFADCGTHSQAGILVGRGALWADVTMRVRPNEAGLGAVKFLVTRIWQEDTTFPGVCVSLGALERSLTRKTLELQRPLFRETLSRR
jgi:hypothetical protein